MKMTQQEDKEKEKEITYFGQIYGLTRQEWNGMRCYWNTELKKSGLNDVEMFSLGLSKTRGPFMDDLFRSQSRRKIVKYRSQFIRETISYYRAVGIAAYNTDIIPLEYRDAAILLAKGISLLKISKMINPPISHSKLKNFFCNKEFKDRLCNAVRELDEESLDD